MFVYICGTALAVILSIISVNLPRSHRLGEEQKVFLSKTFAFLSFLPLTIIMAVRYNVGSDFLGYYSYFSRTKMPFESGFKALYALLRRFTDNPQSIIILSSVMICSGYFIAIYRESCSPAYSVLLFVIAMDYFGAMNGIRQYLATAIALFALPYVKNKKWGKAILILLIASLFHRSVIVYVGLYALYIFTIPPLIAGGAAIAAYVFSQILSKYIFQILERYNFYYGYFLGHYQNTTGKINWVDILISISFLLLFAYEFKKVKESKNLRLMYSGVLIILFVAALSRVLPVNAFRVSWYMNPLIILYAPEAVRALKNKYLRFVVNAGIILLYGFGTTYRIMVTNWHNVLPYMTMWS